MPQLFLVHSYTLKLLSFDFSFLLMSKWAAAWDQTSFVLACRGLENGSKTWLWACDPSGLLFPIMAVVWNWQLQNMAQSLLLSPILGVFPWLSQPFRGVSCLSGSLGGWPLLKAKQGVQCAPYSCTPGPLGCIFGSEVAVFYPHILGQKTLVEVRNEP